MSLQAGGGLSGPEHGDDRPTPSGKVRFADVPAAAAPLQQLLPDAVLVGGTAAAWRAGHRVSFDDDHVLTDLSECVETGIRQLRRRRPLKVEEVTVGNDRLRVPTSAETLRVKAWLVLDRNATRDYLDVVALADQMGPESAAAILLALDDYYADQRGPGGARVATQVARQLAEPAPYDLDEVDLRRYRELAPRWRRWDNVADACRRLASLMLDRSAERPRIEP
jgi:hypothetical protein